MYRRGTSKLTPRDGHKLVVGIVARISGCKSQKEISLDDQTDHAKEEVAELYDRPVEYRIIATKGKGERIDRPELARIEEMLRSRELDLLIMEDVGRLVRGADACRIWGVAVDNGTRCIAPHDCLDTANDTWEEELISACRDHVGHNAHTSRRIKQKLMNRFRKYGGATPCEIAGYRKPEGAKTYADWQKVPDATPTIQQGLILLRETGNCSRVAEYFNEVEFLVGKYCRGTRWDGKIVRRFYSNRLLAGFPGRGFRHTVKIHGSGSRKSVENPDGPYFLEYPHLAHVDVAELDAVNELLKQRNSTRGRKPYNGTDPLLGRPRKRTRFPGQHARCWYCGREFVWGGNGMTHNLMCSGARQWRCWNSFGFNGPLAASRLVELITVELHQLDAFDDQFAELVEAAAENRAGSTSERWQLLLRDESTLKREMENLTDAIAQLGLRPMLKEKLEAIELQQRILAGERHSLERHKVQEPDLPKSVATLRELMQEQFRNLAIDSPEFGDLMRQLVPEFHVYLVRLCDGGHPLPRARVRLNLAGGMTDLDGNLDLQRVLTRELTIDLFAHPPQRERIRVEAVGLATQGFNQRQIAAKLSERPKQPAVQRALALDQMMRDQGLESPYVTLFDPPDDYPKLRRHRNPNYEFQALEDFRRLTL